MDASEYHSDNKQNSQKTKQLPTINHDLSLHSFLWEAKVSFDLELIGKISIYLCNVKIQI